METVAILVDGGFYLKRARRLGKDESAEAAAETLYQYCIAHLSQAEGDEHVNDRLYRIFYYDCPPLEQSVFDPLQGKAISLRKTPQYTWMTMFQDELRSKRKMALRFGKLASDGAIQKTLTYDAVKRLVNGTLKREELTDADFFLNIKQKGVDMRIGLDIASMAFKNR